MATKKILRQSRFYYFIFYDSYNDLSSTKLRLCASSHTNPDLEKIHIYST